MADRPARLVSLATWAVAACGTATLALQLFSGAVGRWITPLQALTPWGMPFVFAAALVAMLRNQHPAALTNAVVAVLFLALCFPLAFPSGLPAAADSGSVRVLHANLLYGNRTIDATIAAMVAVDADVIAVSELTPEWADEIAASPIGSTHPFTELRPGSAAHGLGVWSRLPFTDLEPVRGTTMTMTVGVQLDGEPLRIVLTHPLPPLFNGPRWRTEIDALEHDDPAELRRTAIVGDFNVSYYHPPYRRLVNALGMTDVHQALGHGFSFSWPTDEWMPPFVRLDHALVGGAVTATAIDDVNLPGSDHLAFVVTLAWAVSGD